MDCRSLALLWIHTKLSTLRNEKVFLLFLLINAQCMKIFKMCLLYLEEDLHFLLYELFAKLTVSDKIDIWDLRFSQW